MKSFLLISIFLTSSLFANYAYDGQNSGKIDMHGGKGTSLLGGKSKFSSSKMNSLGNIGITKPKGPLKPETLIKKELPSKKTKTQSTSKEQSK